LKSVLIEYLTGTKWCFLFCVWTDIKWFHTAVLHKL
jgi:hypothetical protein